MNRQENDSLDRFIVELSPDVYEEIERIRDYISRVKGSPKTAEKWVVTLLDDLSSLSHFPERGFLVAKRLGRNISRKHGVVTRGLVVGKRNYIALYNIDESKKLVQVILLVSSNSNWARLFF